MWTGSFFKEPFITFNTVQQQYNLGMGAIYEIEAHSSGTLVI